MDEYLKMTERKQQRYSSALRHWVKQIMMITGGLTWLGLSSVIHAQQELQVGVDIQAMGWASACVTCHGASPEPLPDQIVPPIAGLPVDEFMAKMQQFYESKEPGALMVQTIKGYDVEVLQRIAQWYAQQGAQEGQ